MFVVISAVGFYQVGLLVVRRFIQITVGFDKAGAVKRLACIVADNELNVSFIKVTQLRRKRMANVLVGDHHLGSEAIPAGNSEVVTVHWSDEFLRT